MSSTGKSEPSVMRAPWSMTLRNAYRPLTRSGPLVGERGKEKDGAGAGNKRERRGGWGDGGKDWRLAPGCAHNGSEDGNGTYQAVLGKPHVADSGRMQRTGFSEQFRVAEKRARCAERGCTERGGERRI